MASTFAFGSYIPAKTPVHMMNAQVKIILACVFSIVAFFVNSWAGMALEFILLFVGFVMARVPLRCALRGLVPVIAILAFTILVHLFSIDVNQGVSTQAGAIGSSLSFAFAGSFGVTLDGFLVGAFLALRIAALFLACSLLTFTTATDSLTSAIASALRPLSRIGVPADDVAMVMSMALRFVPQTADEALSIKRAQMARGADFEARGIVKRTLAWGPVLVPLFVNMFRHADRLGMAMEARCYGQAVRTKRASAKLRTGDVCAFVLVVALLVVAVLV